jgi:hypothetical protein
MQQAPVATGRPALTARSKSTSRVGVLLGRASAVAAKRAMRGYGNCILKE